MTTEQLLERENLLKVIQNDSLIIEDLQSKTNQDLLDVMIDIYHNNPSSYPSIYKYVKVILNNLD